MNREQKLRKFLEDPMGPRRWVIGGACSVVAGSLFHLLQEQSRPWTSEPMIIIGAVLTVMSTAVEVLVRLRLRSSVRQGQG